MSQFLETDIREQQKYEKRIQISVDNTVNGLHDEIKFENCVKNEYTFFYSWKSILLRFLRIQWLEHFFAVK